MNKEYKNTEVWNILTSSIFEILPDCHTKDITPDQSLKELGANSVDRAEIITTILRKLSLKVPLIEFAQAKNLGELQDIFVTRYL